MYLRNRRRGTQAVGGSGNRQPIALQCRGDRALPGDIGLHGDIKRNNRQPGAVRFACRRGNGRADHQGRDHSQSRSLHEAPPNATLHLMHGIILAITGSSNALKSLGDAGRFGTVLLRRRSQSRAIGTKTMDIRTSRATLETTAIPNPRSTAKVEGHPIHPMLVPFPIAFFVATFGADIGYAFRGDTGWVMASEWLLGAGLVFAGLAALAGLTDFLGDRRIRRLNAAWWHMAGNLVAVAISAWNFYIRYHTGAAAGLNSALTLVSALVVVILCFTGWKGWEMVYRDRVGVSDC